MDEETKKALKDLARSAEAKVTESILKWKYKKDGHRVPDEERLKAQSRRIADQAREALSRRGKTVWNELKNAYGKHGTKEDSKD